MSHYVLNDGGRSAAGYQGNAGDCVARSIAIAAQLPYKTVYDRLALGNQKDCGIKSARNGIFTRKKWFKDYMVSIGFKWIPTMSIGSGCKVHLNANELPKGNVIARVSKHYVAVIDGVINDTYDCSRDGNRCVYGYWIKE